MLTTFRSCAIDALLLAVTLSIGSEGRLSAQEPVRDPRCRSDAGTIRACLVPVVRIEGRANIPVRGSDCYWLKEDDKEKRKQYKRTANGRPRQFTFQVTNLCSASVDVRLDLATAGDLRFQTARCEPETEKDRAMQWLAIPLGSIASGAQAELSCDTLPYEHKWWRPLTRRRAFRLAATSYGGKPLDADVFFDPEIVLERSRHD